MWGMLVGPSWFSDPSVQWTPSLVFVSCLVWSTSAPAKRGCRLDVV